MSSGSSLSAGPLGVDVGERLVDAAFSVDPVEHRPPKGTWSAFDSGTSNRWRHQIRCINPERVGLQRGLRGLAEPPSNGSSRIDAHVTVVREIEAGVRREERILQVRRPSACPTLGWRGIP